jgi:hypothetical protein
MRRVGNGTRIAEFVFILRKKPSSFLKKFADGRIAIAYRSPREVAGWSMVVGSGATAFREPSQCNLEGAWN